MRSDLGLVFAIASSILSSIGAIYQAASAKVLGGVILACFGNLLGGFLLLLLLAARKQRVELAAIQKNSRDMLLLITLRSFVAALLFNYGMEYTTGIKVIFLTKIEPYFVLLWSWVLERQRVQRRHALLLVVHLGGAFLLSTGGSFNLESANLGDILIIMAIGCVSLSYFQAKNLTHALGSTATNAFSCLAGGLLLLPFAWQFIPELGGAHSDAEIRRAWIFLIVYVVLFHVLALTLWFRSLRSVRPWMVSAFRATGPLVGAPFAWFFFGEELSFVQLIGGVLILITSAGIARVHYRK